MKSFRFGIGKQVTFLGKSKEKLVGLKLIIIYKTDIKSLITSHKHMTSNILIITGTVSFGQITLGGLAKPTKSKTHTLLDSESQIHPISPHWTSEDSNLTKERPK